MKWIATILATAILASLAASAAQAQDRGVDDLIEELESIIAAEKAKRDHDRALVTRLEGLVRKYRAGRSGGDDGGSEESPPRRPGGGGRGVDRVLDRLIGDVELDDAERKQVVRVLTEFYQSWQVLRQNAAMESLSDVEKDRDNRLARAVGRRRQKDISRNVDEMVRRWGRWGGGGGRGR